MNKEGREHVIGDVQGVSWTVPPLCLLPDQKPVPEVAWLLLVSEQHHVSLGSGLCIPEWITAPWGQVGRECIGNYIGEALLEGIIFTQSRRRKDDTQAGYSTLYLPKISLIAIPSHSHVKQAATCDHTVQHILVFKDVHTFVPICPLGGIGIQNLDFNCEPWRTSSFSLSSVSWNGPLVLFFSKRWKCIQISFRIQFLIFKKEIWKNGTDVYY